MTTWYQVVARLMVATLLGIVFLPMHPAWAATNGNPCAVTHEFRVLVTITNVSDQSTTPTAFAPGIWLLAHGSGVLFNPDFKMPGLEALAEDGNPEGLAAALTDRELTHGVFNTPAGAAQPGPIQPGESYSFAVDASASNEFKLTLALMIVETNDWFIGTDTYGIALQNWLVYPDMDEDVTDHFYLWDAGTEADEPLGKGANQAPRQTEPNSGPQDNLTWVRRIFGDDVPAVSDLVSVTLRRYYDTMFDVTILNRTVDQSLRPTAFAPGVFTAHANPATVSEKEQRPLFRDGQPQLANGLEALAEDGNPHILFDTLAAGGSGATAKSPRAYGIFDTPAGTAEPGLLQSGDTYTFSFFTDRDAPRLSLAFMLVESNDWFVATPTDGIPLFQADGSAISGPIQVHLYDAGTEEDEPVGEGSNQAPRQVAPNTGPADDEPAVRRVEAHEASDWVTVKVTPRVAQEFKITITNVSEGYTLAPGILFAHGACHPLFTEGKPDRGIGLQGLAERGDPYTLATNLVAEGHAIRFPFDPYRPGWMGSFLMPGAYAEAIVRLVPAQPYLSMAYKYIIANAANDIFLATPPGGLSMWGATGTPLSGDVTWGLSLWDAGTVENEDPGPPGPQPMLERPPDAMVLDPNPRVRPVDDGYTYPAVQDLIQVTVTPIEDEEEPSASNDP